MNRSVEAFVAVFLTVCCSAILGAKIILLYVEVVHGLDILSSTQCFQERAYDVVFSAVVTGGVSVAAILSLAGK